MDTNKVGKNIKNARKAKGLTQKNLAKLLGCSHTTISKYEQGEIENMPRPRMQKMAEILGVSPIILFDFADYDKQYSNNIFSLYKSISNTSLPSSELHVVKMLNKLNEDGKQKAEAYIKDLLGNPLYNEKQTKQEYTLADYGQIAAEGGEGSREPNVEEFDIL